MINSNDVVKLVSGSKDLIAVQDYKNLNKKLNTGGVSFNVTEGLGDNTATSSMVFINSGGFQDQKITAVMNYPSATTAGNEDIGVMLRTITTEGADASYYYARVDGGFAKITKVLDGTFSTLTSQAFALGQGENVTITFSAVGNVLSATFDAGGSPATVELSALDDSIPTGGVLGFRSLSSAVWCRSLAWEQL